MIIGLVDAAMIVLGVGVVFAQGPAPYAGNGCMRQNGAGYLHTYMVTSFAEKLGLKIDDVDARLTVGETMYEVGNAAGVKADDFPALMIEVRSQAVSAALKAGTITEEQANWMNSHGFGRGGYGTGNCSMQNGQGGQANPGGGFGPGMMSGNGRGMMRAGWQNQPTNP